MRRAIVWAIGGSDSGGGAGVQADIRTIHGLGAHACTIVTALTAQSSRGVESISPVATDVLTAQWRALAADLSPAAIKIGMLPSAEHVRTLRCLMSDTRVPVILDPVLRASAGGTLARDEVRDAIARELMPLVDMITPNLSEASELLGGRALDTPDAIEAAARELASFGIGTVVIKGGHAKSAFAQDCVLHRGRVFWLTNERIASRHLHGTGCTFASAIAGAIAAGHGLVDAIVVAKMFVTAAIRNSYAAGSGSGPVEQAAWPEDERDLPWLNHSAADGQRRPQFPALDTALRVYAIVDSAAWIERLAGSDVGAIQLRVKSLHGDALREQVGSAIRSARAAGIPLFINDHWREAIELGAFGVHLGQEDLETADVRAIESAGLRLGVSTHCYKEVARAHALRPSYIAIGPVFETKIKVMKFAPQGIAALRRWRRTLSSYPLVAIGGIDPSNAASVAATGVDSIAAIRSITLASDPHTAIRHLAEVLRMT